MDISIVNEEILIMFLFPHQEQIVKQNSPPYTYEVIPGQCVDHTDPNKVKLPYGADGFYFAKSVNVAFDLATEKPPLPAGCCETIYKRIIFRISRYFLPGSTLVSFEEANRTCRGKIPIGLSKAEFYITKSGNVFVPEATMIFPR